MRTRVYILFILAGINFLFLPLYSQHLLFPVIENDRWGYIDTNGVMVIAPTFLAAGSFSEGLAPVRLQGTYGYIDEAGNFFISPYFDMAYPYKNGIAKVYVDGKPYFIDEIGRILFEHPFMEIAGFGQGAYSMVITNTKKFGLINQQGKLMTDTVYKKIYPFTEGYAVVEGPKHKTYTDSLRTQRIYEVGVIDSTGNMVVPYGAYKEISGFKSGLAKVELNIPQKGIWYDHQGVIDTKGALRFIVPASKWHWDYDTDEFWDGVAVVDIFTVDPNTIDTWGDKDYTYKGVINTEGKIVISNPDWYKLTPFKYNRAFVMVNFEEWYLIDKSGKKLNTIPYKEILYKNYGGEPEYLFQNYMEFVRTNEGWVSIDTMGNILSLPFQLDKFRNLNRRGDLVFFTKDISTQHDDYIFAYGFWNTKTGVITEPKFHQIFKADFRSGLTEVVENGLQGYINPQGNYVWQQKKDSGNIRKLNIDYMNRAYCYAASGDESKNRFMAWDLYVSECKGITDEHLFPQNQLAITIRKDSAALYENSFEGTKMYVSNTGAHTLAFNTQDNRLNLHLQARDKYGVWRDIEYLPNSGCGNSYYMIILHANTYWEFIIPNYQGSYNTVLRAKLLYLGEDGEVELYSHEFEGSINPGQFWKKPYYIPFGIMDPYND